jgi:hypothetical protein
MNPCLGAIYYWPISTFLKGTTRGQLPNFSWPSRFTPTLLAPMRFWVGLFTMLEALRMPFN